MVTKHARNTILLFEQEPGARGAETLRSCCRDRDRQRWRHFLIRANIIIITINILDCRKNFLGWPRFLCETHFTFHLAALCQVASNMCQRVCVYTVRPQQRVAFWNRKLVKRRRENITRTGRMTKKSTVSVCVSADAQKIEIRTYETAKTTTTKRPSVESNGDLLSGWGS